MKLYLCYRLEDKVEDVKFVAVCTSEEEADKHLRMYDCYRIVDANEEIPELNSLEGLWYKTKDGYCEAPY